MPDTHLLALVLIARPGSDALDAAALRMAGAALGDSPVHAARWLAEGEACELVFEAAAGAALAPRQALVGRALAGRPIDVNIVPADATTRRKRLLIADMDSTIIEQECIDEMADMLGLKAQVALITERAMQGEIGFEAALTERVGLLKGLTAAELERVWRERVTLMPGAKTLVATMRAHGAFAALVSGGFTYYTSRVAAAVGFDVDQANTLGIADGRLTGAVIGPILGKAAKLAALQRYALEQRLDPALTLAVGDGANDQAMIEAAGLGVAYRAKAIVAAKAAAGITHGDLTALLYLQGYAMDEFVGA